MKDVVANARSLVGRNLNRIYSRRNSQRFVAAVVAARPHGRVAFGVGLHPLPGWINTDVTRSIGMFLDVTRPWPEPCHSVSHIYAEHVIEHFPLDVGRRVLRNCESGLVPGGRIRLATPDLERAARAYLEKSDVGIRHLEHYRPTERVTEHPVDLIRTLFAYDDHWRGYIYDFDSIALELERAGFIDILRVDPGESDDPAFRGLESRTDGSFFHMQLVVEASTPTRSA